MALTSRGRSRRNRKLQLVALLVLAALVAGGWLLLGREPQPTPFSEVTPYVTAVPATVSQPDILAVADAASTAAADESAQFDEDTPPLTSAENPVRELFSGFDAAYAQLGAALAPIKAAHNAQLFPALARMDFARAELLRPQPLFEALTPTETGWRNATATLTRLEPDVYDVAATGGWSGTLNVRKGFLHLKRTQNGETTTELEIAKLEQRFFAMLLRTDGVCQGVTLLRLGEDDLGLAQGAAAALPLSPTVLHSTAWADFSKSVPTVFTYASGAVSMAGQVFSAD